MPKNKVLTRQARKMVDDVNCYIKKETNEIVGNLKQVKNTIAEANISIQKQLATPIQRLHLVANRTTSATDKSVLIEICNKLEQIVKKKPKIYFVIPAVVPPMMASDS